MLRLHDVSLAGGDLAHVLAWRVVALGRLVGWLVGLQFLLAVGLMVGVN